MADFILGLAGILLSLIFSYVPRASDWFATLNGERKRLVMLALCALVTAAMVGLACAKLAAQFGVAVTCDQQGIVEVLRAFATAVVMNQTTYLLSPQNK